MSERFDSLSLSPSFNCGAGPIGKESDEFSFLSPSSLLEGLARAEVEESGVESSSEEVAVSAFATSICF